VLAKTKKKLLEATDTIESAETRTRAIERKLRTVQETPSESPALPLPAQDVNGDSLKIFND
jgi:DNA recombination protein RmuC